MGIFLSFTVRFCCRSELHIWFKWAPGRCSDFSWKHRKASGKHLPLVIIKAALARFHMEYPWNLVHNQRENWEAKLSGSGTLRISEIITMRRRFLCTYQCVTNNGRYLTLLKCLAVLCSGASLWSLINPDINFGLDWHFCNSASSVTMSYKCFRLKAFTQRWDKQNTVYLFIK